jgi:hypothetical protein
MLSAVAAQAPTVMQPLPAYSGLGGQALMD